MEAASTSLLGSRFGLVQCSWPSYLSSYSQVGSLSIMCNEDNLDWVQGLLIIFATATGFSDRIVKSDKRPEYWPKRPAPTGESRHLTGETLPVVETQLQPQSRIVAPQQGTSLLRLVIFPLNHVHDPAAQVPRHCLRCPQLLPLVHLARPRLRNDLRRGWREQALRLRLRHRTDLRAHGDQLKSQRQH